VRIYHLCQICREKAIELNSERPNPFDMEESYVL
jgi:hypothetical protein